MGNSLQIGFAGLGRADIQAVIELKGVGVDDLAADLFGECDCQCRFTRRSGTNEIEWLRFQGSGECDNVAQTAAG